MALNNRASLKVQKFNLAVSYRINETENKLRDCRNVYSGQDRLIKRNGASRYNGVALPSSVLSTSYYEKSNSARSVLAKAGENIYSVAVAGQHTLLKSGLTSTTKHRAITLNDRHISVIEGDGLFSYDGAIFTQLGQVAPSGFGVDVWVGGSLAAETYGIKLTFYASGTGFETNASSAESYTLGAANLALKISGIPISAANKAVDKVRIYMSKGTGLYYYSGEVDLGTIRAYVYAEVSSSQVPPIVNAPPKAGGGKYLTTFNRKLVYAGNETYPNDVFFSEQDLPDAFDDDGDTNLVLYGEGNGKITGLATGFYSDGSMEPYLCIFKKSSIEVYSEKGGFARKVMVDPGIGCVSHDTIIVKSSGNVFFLSERGWRVIVNGSLIEDDKNNPLTLGNGDIDDIFTSYGYEYEVAKTQLENSHSVFYPPLDQYITWVAEGVSTDFKKAYVYEFSSSGGFKVYNFSVNCTCSCIAEDADGNKIVLYGSSNGFLHSHSILESKNDVDTSGTAISMETYAYTTWIVGKDYDATYNFRELVMRGVSSIQDVIIRGYINFITSEHNSNTLNFDPTGENSFILDISLLDVGLLAEGRMPVTDRTDINRTGECLSLGFYQNTLDADMQLISYQLDYNKNKNRNK